jgi:DNA-binding winged helix-turn-helix (wHTH) protein/predicted ATPase
METSLLPPPSWHFGAFRLDATPCCLWHGEQVIPLPHKPLAVLAYLVTHGGQVVPKEALLEAVWPKTAVTEGVLKTCIRQIRQALGDTARTSQYITTMYGRGYRFLVPVTAGEWSATRSDAPSLASPDAETLVPEAPLAQYPARLMVAREAELNRLHQQFAQACAGTRQVVWVTGEAGIGKTTLVNTFLAQVATTTTVCIGQGQCIEHYGASEAYLPLLEALGRLGRGPQGTRLVACLRQLAPSWLLQLPGLVPDEELAALQRRSGGATRERMLRELAEAIEVWTSAQPLVLVLEDLHWSDAATIEWLSYVARRHDGARLLVIGTYRPAEALGRQHPVYAVTQDLQVHGQGTELGLETLSVAAVATYLAQRFSTGSLPAELASVLHQRTAGNPFFMIMTVDDLVRQRILRQGKTGWELAGELENVAVVVPDSVQQLILQQFEQLGAAEQRLLAVASVAGQIFSAAAVAAGGGQDVETVEMTCHALARRGQFLRICGTDTWPDGTVATRYAFLHDVARETLYGWVPMGQRVQWHHHIGIGLETGYGPQARGIAAELAAHFVQGRDPARAVQYLHAAGGQALQRSAPQEAITHLTAALDLLSTLPATPERTAQELQVRMALGPALMTTRGFSDPEVADTYRRAWTLCQHESQGPERFPVLWGLWQFANGSAQHQIGQELGGQLLHVAQQQHDPVLLVQAHHARWSTGLSRGTFAEAYASAEHGMRLYTPAQHGIHVEHYGVDDPGVCCRVLAAQLLWLLGYPDQAVQQGQAALELAQELGHPFSLAYAIESLAEVLQCARDVPAVQELAETALELGANHGFPYVVALSTWQRGWALAAQGRLGAGLAQMCQGLTAWQALGTPHMQPLYLADIAEVYGKMGRIAEGLAALAEALRLVDTTGERRNEAELYRLQGELLLQAGSSQPPTADTPEACFVKALAVARQQQAKSLELRAAMSLSRLWQQHGKHRAAHQLLAEVYGWFTEGFATPDLRAARALLAELAVPRAHFCLTHNGHILTLA